MNKTDLVKKQLLALVVEVNASPYSKCTIAFNQQEICKENMSLSGGNGRIFVQPSAVGYDVTLSGLSLEKQMYSFMRELFGHECNGHKQTNMNKGFKRAPFWRTPDFKKVSEVAHHYAETTK